MNWVWCRRYDIRKTLDTDSEKAQAKQQFVFREKRKNKFQSEQFLLLLLLFSTQRTSNLTYQCYVYCIIDIKMGINKKSKYTLLGDINTECYQCVIHEFTSVRLLQQLDCLSLKVYFQRIRYSLTKSYSVLWSNLIYWR